MPDDEVLKEFAPVGKYRIRLLKNTKLPGQPILDVREYVKSEDSSFEGFTRRGIRLSDRAHLDLLRSALAEILEGRTG
jgi:hypothetical protein